MARRKGSARVPEATYNLHIIFELELELLTGKFKVADLPAAWNARLEQFFGIVPPNR
jgi:carboxypeptidase Taq